MQKTRKRATAQRGISILLALLVVLMLTGAGLGLMYMSVTETGVNNNFRSSMAAYYASRAGLDEARDRLRGNPNPIAPPVVMATTATTAGVVYIINSDGGTAVTPWVPGSKYFDDELCHENFAALGVTSNAPTIPCTVAPAAAYYTAVPSTDPNTGTPAAVPYKWVRINLKQNGSTWPYCVDGVAGAGGCTTPAATATAVCADGNGNEVLLPAAKLNPADIPKSCEAANLEPVYTITSLAMTNTNARRITQVEVAPVTMPPLPGGLVLDGPSPVIGTPHSNPYFIDGHNANSCAANPAGGDLPAIGVINNPDIATVSGDLFRPANYTGSGGTTPDVENVNSNLGVLDTVGGLQDLVTSLTNVADQVVPNGGTPASWGTAANPLVTVVQGDFSACNACSGYGILVVEGNLTMSGAYNWHGAILVIGKGNFSASNGGGNGSVTGGIFVANLYNQAQPFPANWPPTAPLLPRNSVPGQPSVVWNGGGGNNIQYDACYMHQINNRLGYKVLTSREEMY
jgi:hypothetical protein